MVVIGSTARLVDPANGQELVRYGAFTSSGILQNIDLGFPQPRESVTNRSGTHGVLDTTKWASSRAIVATIAMPEPPNTDIAVDNLAGLLNPALRLWLHVQRPNWDEERRIQVRGAAFTCPPAVLRVAQASWVAPDAMFQAAQETSLVLRPTSAGTGGLTMPIVPPISFTGGLVSGAGFAVIGGNAPTPFVVDMFGPCSDPLFRCISTGEQVKFTGLTLAAGDFLRLDTGAGTALLNGLTDQSRMNKLDFTSSNPLMLLPGGVSSQVVYSPSSPSGNCQAVVQWRSRWF